ncbi:MAG: TrkA family potassium uptake protein [Candidatus Eisenbacteria bacterium]|nr:TrkA family potassium uptake protein [Candidatus Eisenbacteria bacterium]
MSSRRVVIAGEGRLLYFLARRFLDAEAEVSLLTPHKEQAELLARRFSCLVVHGDPTQPRSLEEAGAGKATDVVAATERDENNLVICQLAHRHFEADRTVAIVQDPDFVSVFRDLGVGAVVSTADLLSRIVEQRTALEGLESLVPVAGGEIIVSDVVLKEGTAAVGRRLRDLGLPGPCLVGCVVRGEKVLIPDGDFEFQADDRAVILVEPRVEGDAIRVLKEGTES